MIAREARLNALRRADFTKVLPVAAEDVTTALNARMAAMRRLAVPVARSWQ
jgi:hypothetical protein